jgi:hypothetical protein
LSAGWESTKRGIPSRRFQLKSNGIVIVCWLTIAKELTCPHKFSEERGQEVNTDCFLRFKILKFDARSGERTVMETWDEMVCNWR